MLENQHTAKILADKDCGVKTLVLDFWHGFSGELGSFLSVLEGDFRHMYKPG
jgi:hypothetical protein